MSVAVQLFLAVLTVWLIVKIKRYKKNRRDVR